MKRSRFTEEQIIAASNPLHHARNTLSDADAHGAQRGKGRRAGEVPRQKTNRARGAKPDIKFSAKLSESVQSGISVCMT